MTVALILHLPSFGRSQTEAPDQTLINAHSLYVKCLKTYSESLPMPSRRPEDIKQATYVVVLGTGWGAMH